MMAGRRWFTAIAAVLMAGARDLSSQEFSKLDSLTAPAPLGVPVSLKVRSVPLRFAIGALANEANATLVFDADLGGLDHNVTFRVDQVPFARALLRLLDGEPIQAMVATTGAVVLTKGESRERRRPIVDGSVSETGGPLGGVHLSLAGTRFEATSDAGGRFSFGSVAAGTYTLRALRMGYSPATQPLRINADSSTMVLLEMNQVAIPIAAVIVTPGYVGIMPPGMAKAQTLSRQQIETVPQLGEDVYRAIGRFAGVATTDYSAKFTVRGQSADELLVTFDGLPLVEPFHLKDMGSALSIVDMATLGTAELTTGGTSAEYGDQMAGYFRMRSIEPRTDRTRAATGLSLTNLRAMAQGGFANGNGGWLASGRRGYLDLAFKLANISDSVSPSYDDFFAKAEYALPHGGLAAMHVLHAGDQLHYIDRDGTIDSRYTSDYAWLTLDARVGGHAREESVAWLGRLGWHRMGDGSSRQHTFHVADVRDYDVAGAKQDWLFDFGKYALFKIGADARHETADYDYANYVRRFSVENHVWVADTTRVAVALHPATDRLGVYASERVRPFDALTLEAGARYDRASLTHDALIDPRLNVSLQPTRTTTLRGSWGRYSQVESVFGLQVENGMQTFAPAERTKGVNVGVEQSVGSGLAARVEAYDRVTTDLRTTWVSYKSSLSMFPEVRDDRLLLSPGRARSRGLELTLSRDAGGRVDWSANYVLSSTRQLVSGTWLPRPWDQPRALHADWSYHPASNAWRFTVSGVLHSGWPYTPDSIRIDTVGTKPDSSFAAVTYQAGSLYSLRLPAYRRIDARWTRFIDTRSGRVALFVEVYNLLNNNNLRDYYTNTDINRFAVRLTQGSADGLPRIPSFGVNWEF